MVGDLEREDIQELVFKLYSKVRENKLCIKRTYSRDLFWNLVEPLV